MTTYDSTDSECTVSVYREGALAAVGHDLRLRVMSWSMEVDVDSPAVEASFDTGSLEVVGVIADGGIDESKPSRSDRAEIERRIRERVLESRRHPVAVFVATRILEDAEGARLSGSLRLHGVERPLEARISTDRERASAAVELDHTDFGIAPVKALLGALRVKPEVDVALWIRRREVQEEPRT